MTNKLIPYDIVYCSSADDAHHIDQLVGHSYHSIALEEGTPGWQCGKGVDFPQVLVLRFPGNVWLQQLRLLSHEVKIASKVEVRLYKLKSEELHTPPSFEDVRFTKLGYVQFSNNEQSHYESKERKTIHLKAEAYFMKLLFYEPYSNPMNRAEQVGLYAIECVGKVRQRVQLHTDPHLSTYGATDIQEEEELSRIYSSRGAHTPKEENSLNPTPYNSAPRNRQGDSDSRLLPPPVTPAPAPAPARAAFRSVSITQFDNFFVQRAEELIALREAARGMGDSAIMEACNDKMNVLNSISQEMYALEQEKVAAIIEENFGEATRIKEAMEEMMTVVIRETELPLFNESNRPAADHYTNNNNYYNNNSSSNLHRQEYQEPSSSRGAQSNLPSAHIPAAPIASTRNQKNTSLTSPDRVRGVPGEHVARHPPAHERSDSAQSIDDREVSAVVGASMGTEVIGDTDERDVAEFIFKIAGEDERCNVVPPNVVFETRRLVNAVGNFVTACLLSKRFKLREASLVAITERMSDAYAANAALVEDAILRFLDYGNYGLQDSFPNVVLASCIYIRLCIGDEFQCIESVITPLCQLVPRLMTRAADPMPRIREEALGTLEQMVLHPALPSQIFLHAAVADPVDKDRVKVPQIKPRPQLARLFVLQMLLQENRLGGGGSSSGLNLKPLFPTLLLPCLNHANSEVRDISVTITQTLIREQLISLKKTEIIKIRNPALRDAVSAAVNEVKPAEGEMPKKKNSPRRK